MRGTKVKALRRERQVATALAAITKNEPELGPGRAKYRNHGEKHRIHGRIGQGGIEYVFDIATDDEGRQSIVPRRGYGHFHHTHRRPWTVKAENRRRSVMEKASRRRNRPS